MKCHSRALAVWLAISASIVSAIAPAMAGPRDIGEDEDGPEDESYQIEQRQLWFENTRGLRQVPDATQLRAQATRELAVQRRALHARQMAAGEVWQEIGPSSMNMVGWDMGRVSGRINAITPLPGNDDTVYIGAAAGGVWKTTNGGLNWQPIFDEVGTQPIGAVTLDPSNPDAVWVGTGDKNGGGCAGYFGLGVYLSQDGGATWSARNGGGSTAMPLAVVNAVAVQPTDANVVLAGGAGSCNASGSLQNPGVYRSADRGLTWTKVLSINVEDLVFVPGTTTVYASAIGAGVYKSTDGGATWANSGTGLNASGTRMRVALSPSNSSVLYALVGSRLYRSDNGGGTWTQKNSSACEGQCTYNQTLAVHPTDPNTILVGSIRFARSTDGGTTLTPLTSTWGSYQRVHQDTHVVLYSRTEPNRFWVGSDGGIWRTEDAGTSFRNMNANLNIMQFYDIAVHPTDMNIVYGGAQDNGSSGRRTSLLWDLGFASGDGFMNAIDETNPMIVFQTSYPSNNRPYIVRSMLGGTIGSYEFMPTTGLTASANFPWVTPLATAGNRIFVASNILYRASTTGNSWTAISSTLGSAASVITPSQRGMMVPTYVGTSGGRIFRSVDAGVPSPVFSDVTGNYPGGVVSDLAIDPIDPQRVFATRAGFNAAALYRSTSGGTTWTAVGIGLPNVPANSVATDPINPDRVFVATDIGVYESLDGGDTFIALTAGMPLGMVVQDLEITTQPHVLTAGTYGRGAWRMVFSDSTGTPPPTAEFSATVTDGSLTVAFADASIHDGGAIASYAWSFGDGATSSAANPSHTYPTFGPYTVHLVVTDANNRTSEVARTVRLLATPVMLVNGVTLSGLSATQGDDVRYLLLVPPGATNLLFKVTGASGEDADLAVTRNGDFVCESAGATANESCGLAAPPAGTYMATVSAYSALSSYTITGSYTAPERIFENGFEPN